MQLIAEIGTDMSRWRSEKHFSAWLTLAPNNKISGGRLLSSKTQPSANRAAVVLRRCAMSLTRSATALGAYYRRLAYRLGQPKAITATARKLAILVYRVLGGEMVYRDPRRHRLRSTSPHAPDQRPPPSRPRIRSQPDQFGNRRSARPCTCATISFLGAPLAGWAGTHPYEKQ